MLKMLHSHTHTSHLRTIWLLHVLHHLMLGPSWGHGWWTEHARIHPGLWHLLSHCHLRCRLTMRRHLTHLMGTHLLGSTHLVHHGSTLTVGMHHWMLLLLLLSVLHYNLLLLSFQSPHSLLEIKHFLLGLGGLLHAIQLLYLLL